ncbi:MAG: hypothetical protein BWY75_03287 [bacterium ADurb.Bin425]|nr:MAG: hypothetical protein BWY75_03287 [bacterium ADurb.Bin425]
MVGIVFVEQLDHDRVKARALVDFRVALEIRSRGDAPHDDFQRDHGTLGHDVDVFAHHADIVGVDVLRFEQVKDVGCGAAGQNSLAGQLAAPGAISRGDAILVEHVHHVLFARMGIDDLGFALSQLGTECNRCESHGFSSV